MRLPLMTGLTVAVFLIWLVSFILGLPATQILATLLLIPYAGVTAYLAWERVRTRP